MAEIGQPEESDSLLRKEHKPRNQIPEKAADNLPAWLTDWSEGSVNQESAKPSDQPD